MHHFTNEIEVGSLEFEGMMLKELEILSRILSVLKNETLPLFAVLRVWKDPTLPLEASHFFHKFVMPFNSLILKGDKN